MVKTLQVIDQFLKEGQQIANFSAQIEENGNYFVNRNVIDNDLYQTNKDEIRMAFNEFEDQMIELARNIKENGLCN